MSFALPFLHRQLFVKLPVPTTSFQGKTVIVTGSNVGLGLEASRLLVRLGASRLILACRSIEKGRAAAQDIQTSTGCSPETLEVWELDMASYSSVQAFASRVHANLPRLDVFIANAGINTNQFRMLEQDESMITVNVVSLFLLGFLLYPKLRETAAQYSLQTYFTITSSDLHEIAKFEERKAPEGQMFRTLNSQSRIAGAERYATSKLMEILLVKEMAAMALLESRNVVVNCVSPGMCHSELARDFDTPVVRMAMRLLARSAEVGARTIVYGASAGPESHGQYVPDCRIEAARGLCQTGDIAEVQKALWKELGVKLEGIQQGVTGLVLD